MSRHLDEFHGDVFSPSFLQQSSKGVFQIPRLFTHVVSTAAALKLKVLNLVCIELVAVPAFARSYLTATFWCIDFSYHAKVSELWKTRQDLCRFFPAALRPALSGIGCDPSTTIPHTNNELNSLYSLYRLGLGGTSILYSIEV